MWMLSLFYVLQASENDISAFCWNNLWDCFLFKLVQLPVFKNKNEKEQRTKIRPAAWLFTMAEPELEGDSDEPAGTNVIHHWINSHCWDLKLKPNPETECLCVSTELSPLCSSLTTQELQKGWRAVKRAERHVRLLFEIPSSRVVEQTLSKHVVSPVGAKCFHSSTVLKRKNHSDLGMVEESFPMWRCTAGSKTSSCLHSYIHVW